MKFPLSVESYQSRSLPISSQRLINLYAEKSPVNGKNEVALFGTPGLRLFSDISADPIYGLHELKGTLYAFAGSDVYKVGSDGRAVYHGSIGATNGIISLSDNGTQILAVKSNNDGYIITDSTVEKISDVDFPISSSGTFNTQRFIVSRLDTGQIFWSALLDGTSWDALDFATQESNPDDLISVFSDKGELWLFGKNTTEIWYSTGSTDLPFQRVNNGVIDIGCSSKDSVANDDNQIYWLGNDSVVYSAAGYRPTRISTHAIENEIRTYSENTIQGSYGFTYTQNGHKFYVLTFPDAATFVYDSITGMWHERKSKGKNVWRVQVNAFVYNSNIVGDSETGKLYVLDHDYETEDGTTIIREYNSPTIFKDDKRIIFDELRIDLDAGFGLNSGQGIDPQIMLKWSDTGGKTYSNEKWRSMGKIGEYGKRVVWRKLGQSRERIYKFTISDPIRVSITGMYASGRICTR